MPVTTPGDVKDVELVGSWFVIKLDNGIEGFFTDASGFGFEVEVVEKTETKTDTRTIKRPGTTKYQDITLKRTLGPDKKFWNWAKIDPRRHARVPHERRAADHGHVRQAPRARGRSTTCGRRSGRPPTSTSAATT